MTPYCLPSKLSGDDAVRWYRRRRLRNLYGLFAPAIRIARSGDAASKTPPFVERIWMPYYAIRLHAVSRLAEQRIWTTVDAWTGQFAIFECMDVVEERACEEEFFPPGIDEARAVEIARHGLLQFVLRVRGEYGKPVVDAVEEVRMLYTPVWALYFRRGRALDIRALDGFTGKDGGAKMRVAVLNALVAARKARSRDRL